MTADSPKPKIVVICGPTGVGKTAVAIDLAGRLAGEIVGADSMQIYRFMDIGTAKPTLKEQAAAPHHMIDIVDPDEQFDAARYARMARRAIGAILDRQRLPIVAGGTGFYIRALLGGLFDRGASDPAVRGRLRREAEAGRLDALHRRLATCDPVTAAAIHPNDAFRIIRALEVYEVAGEPLSEYHRRHGFTNRPYNVLTIGLEMERDRLYDRINRRVETMMDAGFLEEVRNLLDRGYNEDLKPMQSIGYRHMVDLVLGRCDRDTALTAMKRDTRRYAKRQMTWFRGDSPIHWEGVDTPAGIHRRVGTFLALT